MTIAVPPEPAVSKVVGSIEGKSASHLARVQGERKRNFVGRHVWGRILRRQVGRDKPVIRNSIRNQEKDDARLEQTGLWR